MAQWGESICAQHPNYSIRFKLLENNSLTRQIEPIRIGQRESFISYVPGAGIKEDSYTRRPDRDDDDDAAAERKFRGRAGTRTGVRARVRPGQNL